MHAPLLGTLFHAQVGAQGLRVTRLCLELFNRLNLARVDGLVHRLATRLFCLIIKQLVRLPLTCALVQLARDAHMRVALS